MSVKISTVATAIAAIDLSGNSIDIKDIDEIPEESTVRSKAMFPDPDGFVSNLGVSRETMGLDSAASKNVTYTLNYVYLSAPAGSNRFVASAYDDLVDEVVIILNALANNSSPTGSIDISPRVEGEMGTINDVAGNLFYGCRIAVDILEYYEVSA